MQEIEPITYQKTTNIEEHRQFLEKINEIINNLSPTVDAAEAAVAEAAQALADAVAAIETANAASAAAQAAADRAAQSVATVAGYNERVTDIERTYIKNASSVPQVIDSDLQIVNGHSLSVADDVDISGDLNVAGQAEIAGMAFEQSGTKTILSNANGVVMDGQLILDSMSVGTIEMGALRTGVGADGSTVLNNANGIKLGQSVKVPTTTTGTRSEDAVNGIRLQNDLDNYALMLRTVGTFPDITGEKAFGYLTAKGVWNNKTSKNIESTSSWVKVYETKVQVSNQTLVLLVSPAKIIQDTNEYGILMVGGSATNPRCRWMIAGTGIIKENFVTVGRDDGPSRSRSRSQRSRRAWRPRPWA